MSNTMKGDSDRHVEVLDPASMACDVGLAPLVAWQIESSEAMNRVSVERNLEVLACPRDALALRLALMRL